MATKTEEDKPKPDPTPAEEVAWEGSLSATEPVIGPDGHVHLSKEDIRARDS